MASDPKPSRAINDFTYKAGIPPVIESYENPYDSPSIPSLEKSNLKSSTFVMIGVFLLVWFGITLILPGVGIALAILSVPPLIRTLLVFLVRTDRWISASPWEHALLFAGSFGVTLVATFIVLVLAFGALYVMCIDIMQDATIPWAILVILTISLSALFVWWIRARWLRDTR